MCSLTRDFFCKVQFFCNHLHFKNISLIWKWFNLVLQYQIVKNHTLRFFSQNLSKVCQFRRIYVFGTRTVNPVFLAFIQRISIIVTIAISKASLGHFICIWREYLVRRKKERRVICEGWIFLPLLSKGMRIRQLWSHAVAWWPIFKPFSQLKRDPIKILHKRTTA